MVGRSRPNAGFRRLILQLLADGAFITFVHLPVINSQLFQPSGLSPFDFKSSAMKHGTNVIL